MSATAAASNRGKGMDKSEYGKHTTHTWTYCLQLGFWAGLIWGFAHWLLYTFRFTKVLPGMLAEPFFKHSFLVTGWGHAVGIGHFIVFSILAAYLYKLLLGRFPGPWAGFVYGLLWWTLLFLAFGPLLGMVKPVTVLGWNSIFTELSLYAVWGLFIGYTIAFEFTDEASREPKRKPKGGS
ncbi:MULTISPECIES: YqhR family membrane protein [unclassified Paenibacillus]|uniref:YqhR family membrane protein n=1 Tax=Paenibacillus TaxID=44249 RepID=UPI00040BD09C|nr:MULTISPECIES: YqhR family membrane protein [unclassified Paenibacillus]KKC46164.1 hypothetical protein VE23_02080 [Paenibacillus sp. D9]